MRPRTLTFSDAVRLLDGSDNAAIGWLGRLTGVGAAAVTITTGGTVDFFALRDEVVKWGNSMVGQLRERTTGVRRFDRTQRLIAAHSVIVVTAFYEALDDELAEHPEFDLAAARLSAAEQAAIATSAPATGAYVDLVRALIDTPPPMPAPHRPFEVVLDELDGHYRRVAAALRAFLLNLSAYQGRSAAVGNALHLVEERLARRAVDHYSQSYRALAVQAPEFQVWSAMVDGQSTRAVLRDSVAELERQLAGLRAGQSTGTAAVDAVRDGLGRRYRTRLDRPILTSAHAPTHVLLPTLAEGYVNPPARIAVAGPSDLPATEAWWEDSPRVDDLQGFLIAHLSSPAAVLGPLVVLGQPGSGKSVLTRILAARLPQADYLVVRVELRSVPADCSVQAQLEGAVSQLLGERFSWPDLARRAGTALPVVIMDGFDELLQATGVHRADYLEEIQEFQRREAELDRPVAVLLTSRTVVADRARFPEGSVVARLEPFDEEQVRAWLNVWNTLNEAGLRTRSLLPLPADVALSHGELAGQPLLLLLLALYDAGANALQSTRGVIGSVELYERLFADFIAREVDRHGSGRTAHQRQAETEAEWRRLGAVALAMLNRGGDVVLEADLDLDLPHLLNPADLLGAGDPAPSRAHSVARPLTVGQLLVGRFFFIHESQATRDTGTPERSFEFLHATFGEYLAARLIVSALVDLADERIHQRRRPQAALDAGFFYAATSFVTIARRAPLWRFCRGMLAQLDVDRAGRCRELVIELLPEAGYPHPTWSLSGYEPRRKPVAARHAAFSANLVCLAVLLSDGPVDVTELVDEPVLVSWRQQAFLWRSQLDAEDRQRLWQTMRLEWRPGPGSATLQIRVEDGSDVGVYTSLPWPPDRPPSAGEVPLATLSPDVALPSESRAGRAMRRSAFVQTAHEAREFLYVLMPYWRAVGDLHWVMGNDNVQSDAAVLFELLLTPASGQPSTQRGMLYFVALTCDPTPYYRQLVLRQLARDAVDLAVPDLLDTFDLLRPADLQLDLESLARLVATVANRADIGPDVTEALVRRMTTWREAEHQVTPRALHDALTLAFAGVGLAPLPWITEADDSSAPR